MALNHDKLKPWLRLKHMSWISSNFPVGCLTSLYSSHTIPGFFFTRVIYGIALTENPMCTAQDIRLSLHLEQLFHPVIPNVNLLI